MNFDFIYSWNFWIVIPLLCISAIAKGIQDILLTKYDNSIFKKAKNQNFWNPEISWKNKWKNGDPNQGEKFWLSSTWLVGLTDGWHLFGTIRDLTLFICIPLSSKYWFLFLGYLIYRFVFHISYHNIFKEK